MRSRRSGFPLRRYVSPWLLWLAPFLVLVNISVSEMGIVRPNDLVAVKDGVVTVSLGVAGRTSDTANGASLLGEADLALNKGPTMCTLLMNPADAIARGLVDGQKVKVRSKTGELVVEMELSELLASYKFAADTPVVRGSALKANESESTDPNAPEYAPIKELLRVVDEYIPEPKRETDKPFMMAVEDVFSIKGRGTVVTGRVDRGIAKKGEPIEIVGLRDTKSSVITGIEMFHKELDEAVAGDNAGILLRGIERDDVERGQVLVKPGSVTPHKKFLAEVYVLKKEEGGRHKAFFSGYRPQFYIRTMDVTGDITLPEGVEMVMPGDNVNLTVELIVPVALEQGSKFAIREGGLTVGAGVVTKIIA